MSVSFISLNLCVCFEREFVRLTRTMKCRLCFDPPPPSRFYPKKPQCHICHHQLPLYQLSHFLKKPQPALHKFDQLQTMNDVQLFQNYIQKGNEPLLRKIRQCVKAPLTSRCTHVWQWPQKRTSKANILVILIFSPLFFRKRIDGKWVLLSKARHALARSHFTRSYNFHEITIWKSGRKKKSSERTKNKKTWKLLENQSRNSFPSH